MNYLKRAALEGASNFRDLGGYEAGEGRMTRWGILYRSDSLYALTDGDWEALKKRGLGTLIDLRSITEAEQKPISSPEGMICHHFSLMRALDGIRGGARSEEAVLESMRLDYVKTLSEAPDVLAEILDAILEGLSRGAVVFFCSAGKDRTGIVAAALLTLFGVSREDITADYIVSRTYIERQAQSLMELVRKGFFSGRENPARLGALLDEVLDSRPAMIGPLLDAFSELPLEGLLEQHGFSREKQEKLIGLATREMD